MVTLMITKTISNTANKSVAISDLNISLPEITIFISTFKESPRLLSVAPLWSEAQELRWSAGISLSSCAEGLDGR